MLQLIYCLTGDTAYPPILDGQIESYLNKLKQLMENAIWMGKIFGRQGAAPLFEAYNGLSSETQASLLLSPVGFEAVWALAHSVTEERLEILTRLCRNLVSRNKSDGPKENSFIFTVDNLPEVDIGSDFCMERDSTSPVFFGEFQAFTPEEVASLKFKLASAIAEIKLTSPTFLRLIQNYTRTIYIRKNGTLSPASEQVDTQLGGIRLRNVHLDQYTHEQLMDDLIHESVHNFLATFELLNYPFVKFGGHNHANARPVSPWSWRPIRVLPFLHAAFVYFALLHYSILRLRRNDLTEEQRAEAFRRRNHCASGFLMPGRLSSKVKDAADADDRVLQMLDWMQETVADIFAASDLATPATTDSSHSAAA
jgi:hypothetical protein